MNPQHFGSDLTDVGIRIQINPEILDHYGLTLYALVEVCAL